MLEMRGTFDAVETGGATSAVTSISAGQEIVAVGWVLAGDATPWQVAVVIDGQTFTTRDFHDRPDVRATLHAASPAGWRIPVDTAGLAPGKNRLTALAWASEKGEGHYLGERRLIVREAPGIGTLGVRDHARCRRHGARLEARSRRCPPAPPAAGPPLLYHNDLTATVSRYYWSEDVGYALWLRLYDEYSHPGRPHLAG
jgi:hypothetical protein